MSEHTLGVLKTVFLSYFGGPGVSQLVWRPRLYAGTLTGSCDCPAVSVTAVRFAMFVCKEVSGGVVPAFFKVRCENALCSWSNVEQANLPAFLCFVFVRRVFPYFAALVNVARSHI